MDYRDIIESKYDRKAWEALLHDIFKSGANFLASPLPVDSNSNLTESSFQLGSITLKDDKKIAVYEIKLSDTVDIINNRAGIRKLMMSHWKMQGCAGAFMFCYRDKESVLRFSYVSSLLKFNDEGKLEKDETDAKRFTYLLGEGHRSRTAIAQFEKLRDSNLTLDDITKAFSVEALSNSFFNGYKAIYEDIVEYATGKRMVKDANRWEEKIINNPNPDIMAEFSKFENPEKSVRDYVKKLMGRIVFLQFLQKKGWLAVPIGQEWGSGDKEFLKNLFENCQNKEDFIDVQLELLFTDINTKRKDDIANPILGKDIKVPYLNGGLFDLDSDDKCKFKLSVPLLTSLSNFFSSYNFTIDENDPNDAEVGVDPEMLGHIFENLLEDNKDKGAFYTPKSIVQYMCSESLIAYLQNDQDKEYHDSIRKFVQTHEIDYLNESLRPAIDEKLKTVKICDPAIGSGAFPMGLLKELFECRHVLESTEGVDDADIKKHIIQNNIYGVDIEKGAVDIARLRFWLSIVVDERTPHALPNMDFKIVQGNSLIPTFHGKFINIEDNGLHMNSQKIRIAKEELYRLQKQFFDAEGEYKKRLLINIKYLILEIVKLQMDYESTVDRQNDAYTMGLWDTEDTHESHIDHEKSELVLVCDKMQKSLHDESKSIDERLETIIPFFDWKIIFPEVFNKERGNGFDIVIGNPPYIQLQTNGGTLAKLYENANFSTFARTGDIYCLFFEKGYNVLKEKGHLCYITSNKWMRAGYGEKTRGFLSKFVNPKLLVDFAGVKIFENATVDTNILLYSKSENQHNTICVVANKNNENCLNKLSEFVQQQHTICNFSNEESWVILSPIEQSIKQKIESVGTPLKDWDIKIYRGILTGYNDAFIISTEKRDEILAKCQTEDERSRTAELIRPILRGRDIKRYEYDWANLWLIATFPSCHYDIEDYPAVKNHLLSYGKERLEQTGKTYTINGEKVKARKKTNNKWFETQDSISYWDDFFKPKIFWKRIGSKLRFSYDINGNYGLDSTCFATGKHIEYLCCILNSFMGHYLLKDSPKTGTGDLLVSVQAIEPILVPYYESMEQIFIQLLKKRLLDTTNNSIEMEINDLVFKLYNLSITEIEYIKNYVIQFQ